MKRILIFGTIILTLLLLLLFVWLHGSGSSVFVPPEAQTPASPPHPLAAATVQTEKIAASADSLAGKTNQENEFAERAGRSTEALNLPVAFYGLVVDQDDNVLQDVDVDLQVAEAHFDVNAYPHEYHKMSSLQRRTGTDGRFELIENGLKGRDVTVISLTKEGYDRELPGVGFGAQSTSFDHPVILRMWRTNIHEQLISGEREFKIVPDGRRYAIDLTKGAITEGQEGDLVVWIKRPESVAPSEKFAWSCGLTTPGGGLEPEKDQRSAMYRAPAGEFTNVFTLSVEDNTRARDGMSLDNRFYFKLRNGKYGRVSASFWTTYHYWAPSYRTDPAFAQIRLSYAINPSGSRLLR